MADIIAFKGVRYNKEKIKDLSKVVAPPYDVISVEEQTELYNISPYNIIRLLLGKSSPSDDDKDNLYVRAGLDLKAWQKKGVLKKDASPGIYINLQEFKVDGKIRRRIGFIALLKLEEFDTEKSSVYPHENTLLEPKEDRTKLIHAIEANLGPVFAIFEDKDTAISDILKNQLTRKPLISVADKHGVKNKLWKISDKNIITRLIGLMRNKKIFIADGHHRYEVGLSFSKFKKDPKYGYILTYFTDLFGEGLVVLPYHRLIGGLDEGALLALKASLKRNFTIKPLKSKKDIKIFLNKAKPTEARFVIYGQKIFEPLEKKPKLGRRDFLIGFTGLVFKDKPGLDVDIAKDLIINPLGKIFIDFTKDLDYAIKEVNKDKYSFAVLVNPVKIEEIRDVAFLGNRMPQKSTYFYPKVLTGLVINVF